MIDFQAIVPAQVRSVYSGKAGKCMCGCAGKHSYNPAHQAEGSKARGYAVGEEELSAAQVTRVLRVIQSEAAQGRAEFDIGGEWISARIGNRDYTAYLTEAAIAELAAQLQPSASLARLRSALKSMAASG